MALRKCAKCGESKPLETYPLHGTFKDGRHTMCAECYEDKFKPWNRGAATVEVGNVYLVSAPNGLVKIGLTKSSPERRLGTMQNYSPLLLTMRACVQVPDYRGTERALQRHFQDYHSHSEWFRLSEEQIKEAKEFLCQVQASQ